MQVIKTTDNSNTISKYIEAMQIEVSPSQKYKDLIVGIIIIISYAERTYTETTCRLVRAFASALEICALFRQ